ncbi:MAG TPA: flagella basal body P-ring formation protein FlgA [Candidatus Aquilonibacter sp.]|nr:flagella basal body P-ring formation protein FlgA [Candidatus Aquilonibacter sp.]
MASLPKVFAACAILAIAPVLVSAAQPSGASSRATAGPASHALSAAELCDSIRRTLLADGAPRNVLPSVAQIEPTLPVSVTVDDPGLQVLRIDPDVTPGVVRVRLWTSNEPAIHPFDVRILEARYLLQWLGDADEATHASVVFVADSRLRGAARFARPLAPKPPELVFPGRRATLLMQSSDMQIRTSVMPLDCGVAGQEVRVRNLSTGEILQAKVTGPSSLVTNF